MKTTAVIAVRMGSSRLPGKALMDIHGASMLERLVQRVQRAEAVDEVMLATTSLPDDDRLEALAKDLGLKCFRGSENDVLERIALAVEASGADRVVEVLGDNPLVDSRLVDDVAAFFEAGGYDYAVNVTTEQPHAPNEARRFPIGVRVEIYRPSVIARSHREATDPYNREHSTSFIGQHPEHFKLGYFEAVGDWAPLHRPDLTFAVNYEQNFRLVHELFGRLLPKDDNFSLASAIAAFDDDPALPLLMGAPQE